MPSYGRIYSIPRSCVDTLLATMTYSLKPLTYMYMYAKLNNIHETAVCELEFKLNFRRESRKDAKSRRIK